MVEHGNLKYKYDVKVNLSDLIDRIMAELGGFCEGYEYEFDDDTLIIHAEDSASYTRYREPATLEEPPVDDIDFYSIKDVDVTAAVLDALHDTEKIGVEVVVFDDYELEGE